MRPSGLLAACLCGSTEAEASVVNDVGVLRCARCGVLRQHVLMTEEEYRGFYAREYHAGVYTHSFGQDLAVAERRVEAHGSFLRGRVLDIGSGNGAFVVACRRKGMEAWGQDLAAAGPDDLTYRGELSSLRFPTGWAQTVTLHDVLEHLPDPKGALHEIARILDPGGFLIVDFPAFHERDGRHHWKPVEHLWMLTEEELTRLLAAHGFRVERIDRPIPGKIVVYARRREEKRPRLLVPPGIGDILWVMAKLRGFIAAERLGLPEVWIDAPDDKRRSLDFVRRVPFVKAGGYHDRRTAALPETPFAAHRGRMARAEAYRRPGQSVFRDIEGFDWFIAFNGHVDAGRALDEIEPRYPVDWDIPLFVSLAERAYGERARRTFGPYVVASFFGKGMYRKWLAEFPAEEIYETVSAVHDATGYRVVLTGAAWDRDTPLSIALMEMDRGEGRLLSLVGETTLEEYFGLLRFAEGCIGFPAGNTMMGAVLDKPTVLVWNDHFDRRMHWNACPPARRYRPMNTRLHDGRAVARAFLDLLES